MNAKSNKLLVLDLDETLIHATEKQLSLSEDFRFDKYFIHKRPYLDHFLLEISKHFGVGIWSSADDDYVTEIAKLILSDQVNVEFVWGRSKCTPKRDFDLDTYYYEKRLDKLKKLGFKLEHTLIVDDTPAKLRYNYGNAVYIKEFLGSRDDNELEHLQHYLLTLKDAENIRAIEKRHWRKLS